MACMRGRYKEVAGVSRSLDVKGTDGLVPRKTQLWSVLSPPELNYKELTTALE